VYRVIEAGSSRGYATRGRNETHVDHYRSGRCRSQLSVVQTLLGLPKSAPAHGYFGQILDADGTVLLCLHQWGTHGHPPLTRPDPPPGNGLPLFFRVDDFDEALPRARSLVSRLEEEPHRNPSTATMEFALRDPDGYYVMVSALSA
jgi:catechol 2,3-dioxygenase-like lactoylglutathione lyase family enzyme